MRPSGAAPTWEHAARDVVEMLDGDETPDGVAMLHEARALLNVFQAWALEMPDDATRVVRITAMVDLNRRVLGHVARRS